ncbi:hypothetical protein [Vibrio lentus]|uniref:hypothetical protein n=1 Tax=Vibrio lentus TaxID=136468 RepID=UPI001054ED1A|nr:hypothetical protein [Vibrio lentus]
MKAHFFRVDYSAGLSGFALFSMADVIEANVVLSIPAGTSLVTGVCPKHMSFDFPVSFDTERPSRQSLPLPIGDISVAITPLP